MMKRVIPILFLVSILTFSCSKKVNRKNVAISNSVDTLIQIPNVTTDKSLLQYDKKTSQWLLNHQPYSGYIVSFHQENILKEKIGVLNGKKQYQAIKWYADGNFQEVANYHQGKLHGEKKLWSTDSTHILISHLQYFLGKAHGEQKQWYATGELYKKMNLNMGKEEGVQQAYRKNGNLYANYEAKNGRIFGLKRTTVCYGLEDETIKTTKE